jgi:hypothetical protein
MPMHDQSMPVPGAMPSDRKVSRRGNGAAEEEPAQRERRQYVLTLPPNAEYAGEDDEQSGLMHIRRHDAGGRGSAHVCSVPAGQYELDRDERGVHLFKVPDRDDEEHGEREPEEERRGEEERDLAMPGAHLLARPSGTGRGRDDGPTEFQRLRAYKERLSRHYDQYRHWIRERTS